MAAVTGIQKNENGTLKVSTGRCLGCGKPGTVDNVPAAGFEAWQAGAHLQDALTTLTPGDREQLLSGTHEPCFDEMFPFDPDDEDE